MIKKNGNNEIKTLSHSTYRCQYHIVFDQNIAEKQSTVKSKKILERESENCASKKVWKA